MYKGDEMVKVQKNKSLPKIPIVFATNENYAPYASVTIDSLIKNSSKKYFYDIYIFYTELAKETIQKFQNMSEENFNVTCLDVNAFIDKELNLYENFHFTKEMYYRILIPSILENYDKVIYLDSDMVILGDISELFKEDISDYVLGGVRDVQHYTSKKYVKEILQLDDKKYINSGMLVINCENFRKFGIKEKCFETLQNTVIEFRYPDQDIINIACKDKIKFLDSCWNYIWHYNFPRYNKQNLLLSDEDQQEYEKKSKDIKIIHYTSSIKPWNNYNTIYSKYFFDYARESKEFKNIIFDRYNGIKMKNYITLQSLEIFGDKALISGAFYSIEDFLYHNSIYVTINGNSSRIKFTYKRNIDLRNLCYVQSFFNITVDLNLIKNKDFEIYFSRKDKPLEHLPVLTGKVFPFDQQIGMRLFYEFDKHKILFFLQDKKLIIKKSSKREQRKYERRIQKKLKTLKTRRGKKSALVRKIYNLTKPFFKKDLWLITDREDTAGDYGEAFFKYLKKNKPKKVKYCFVINKKSPDRKRLKKYGKIIAPNTYRYYLYFIHCKKIVSSHLPRCIIEPFNTVYLKDLLFKKQNIFLQHGIIKDDLSDSYSKFNQGIFLFVTSAPRERNSIVNNPKYNYIGKNIILTGLPRFDFLENEPQKIIYVLPTWRKYLTNISDQQVFKESLFFKTYSSLLENEKLISELKKNDYVLKFIPHELIRSYFLDYTPKDSVIQIEKNNISYNEIFKKGAMLITDYSSVFFDFGYLNKPVLYYQFDKEEFFKNHTYKAGYFKYEDDGFGPVIKEEDDLVDKIIEKINNNCSIEDKYLNRINKFFVYHDKYNCQRTLDAIRRYDQVKLSFCGRVKRCLRVNGLRGTIKKIFKRIFRRK